MRPRGARFVIPELAEVPCICLLIEAGKRLMLVDAGLGVPDSLEPGRLGPGNILLNAVPDRKETAVRKVEGMGYRKDDVTDIICTHLDRDHAGGLSDFPNARVHVLAAELEAASCPGSFAERERYRKMQFAHGPVWVTYDGTSPDKWFGLECIRGLDGLPDEIALVPLPGHTKGHCGVAVNTGSGWLLHCGDAYYVKSELDNGTRVPAGVRLFRRVAHMNPAKAMMQLERLAGLVKTHRGEITVVASHDPDEYERLKSS